MRKSLYLSHMSQSQIQMVNESWVVSSVHCSQVRLRLRCWSGCCFILSRIIIFRLFVIIIRQHYGRVHFPLITWIAHFHILLLIFSVYNKKLPWSFSLNSFFYILKILYFYVKKNIISILNAEFSWNPAEAVFCSRRTTRLVDARWREMWDRSLQFFYSGVG